eukprot:GFYU01007625.1.p1 GENE.GFYU01007625.1~~GFYU01007625.1.p1  ORF type:complete len:305 (+),score=39.00 GFYU01007625.1:131-1045(+)
MSVEVLEVPQSNALAPSASLVRVAKDLSAGTVSGIAATLIGHPFLTVKVRLQTQPYPPVYKGALDAARNIIRQEGVSGFYKGLAPPLVGVGIIYACSFYGYEEGKRLVSGGEQRPLTWLELTGATAIAGLASACAASPVELITVKLQTQFILSDKQLYTGPIDCIRQIVRQGGLRALTKGFGATVVREIPNTGVYFLSYELWKKTIAERSPDGKLGTAGLLVAGGTAGVCAQISQLPFDVVKSRLQTQSPTNPQYSGIIDCFRKTYRADGIGGFYKGIGPVLLRAFPANAVAFFVFENALKLMG